MNPSLTVSWVGWLAGLGWKVRYSISSVKIPVSQMDDVVPSMMSLSVIGKNSF